ncbi:hypothetical protein [Streptomyces sp. NPDC058612]|uniref:hypothetical protein n=1 Tax=Streptomyces sp. NPDC058612 TaxID=3346555 RepID=UPI003661D4DE
MDVVQARALADGADVGVRISRGGDGHRDRDGPQGGVVDGRRRRDHLHRARHSVRGVVRQGDVPDCGHRYTRTSAQAPGGRYPVTATTTWDIGWAGVDQTGTLTATRAGTTSLAIGELQVVNVP